MNVMELIAINVNLVIKMPLSNLTIHVFAMMVTIKIQTILLIVLNVILNAKSVWIHQKHAQLVGQMPN